MLEEYYFLRYYAVQPGRISPMFFLNCLLICDTMKSGYKFTNVPEAPVALFRVE
jgi:hypothetical protein